MTFEDAKKLAAIAVTVHGGCEYCVDAFVDHLNEIFPEFKWGMRDLAVTPYIEVIVEWRHPDELEDTITIMTNKGME